MQRGRCALLLRSVVPAAVVVLSVAACGSDSGEVAVEPPAATSIRISYDRDGTGPASRRSASLSCPSSPHRDLCRRLRRLERWVLLAVSERRVCTMIYGGPQVGRIHGVVEGLAVDARFNRRNGCEIARYAQVQPILRLAARP